MPSPNPDLRKSGIPLTGRLPWGTHFCQFYRTKKDLLDVLVPYIRAGLSGNEYCVWVTGGAVGEEEARKALARAVPRWRAHADAGQIEVVPLSRWQPRGRKPGKAVLSGLEKAIAGGFDGLRLACAQVPDKGDGMAFLHDAARAIRGNNVIAAFGYPKESFDALGIMAMVKEHRFALVRDAGGWQVIESQEARTVRDELRRSEAKLKSLFRNMLEGFAYHRIIVDGRGRPCDYVFLQVNEAFERITGLKGRDIVGRRVSSVIPGIESDPAGWVKRYGKVATTGKPARFEAYARDLARWYVISAFSPHKGYFAVTFTDITERREAEEAARNRNVTLDGMERIFRAALATSTEEEFGRACLAVAGDVTESRFGFIGEIGPDGLVHDLAVSETGWELCAMRDKSGHRRPAGNFAIHGLYGRVLLDARGFHTNDPAAHADSIGVPEGHPPLSAFLGAPLIRDGRLIGMIGMGNREGGYRAEHLEALEALAGAIVASLMRRRAEEKTFEANQRLEGLMASLPVGVSFSDDVTCRRITGNPAVLAQFEVGRADNLSPSAEDGRAAGRQVAYFREGKRLADSELPLQRAVAENRLVSPVELEVELPSGRRWIAEASAAPIHDRHGNVVSGVAVTVDITDRRQAEEALYRILRRYELLVATAAELIRTPEPQEAVETLCRKVMGHLDCDVFFNFLADEKSGRLRLNACAGIPAEEVRRVERLDYGAAMCGCVARDGERLVAEHIPATPDPRTELVRTYGVKAYACHPLLGPGGAVVGTLSFGSRRRETFSDDELSLMSAVTDQVAIAMTRMRHEAALRSSLAEKDVLMRELAHRTKNNMQVIGSLLSLQASASGDGKLLEALADTHDRIRAMALVHEKLYRSGNLSSLNMRDYVADLLDSLLHAHRGSSAPITARRELEDVSISIEAAVPCGLIINELVSNSLKHAFRGRESGEIFVALRRRGGEIALEYRDDGPGLGAIPDLSEIRTLGLKLVYNLAVRQLRGTMEIRRGGGAAFLFGFRDALRGERV